MLKTWIFQMDKQVYKNKKKRLKNYKKILQGLNDV